MSPGKPLLTVVVPIFNEEECIAALVERLVELRNRVRDQVEIENLFVDDGSTDRSSAMLSALADAQPEVAPLVKTVLRGPIGAIPAG